jgi:hypothetical protein
MKHVRLFEDWRFTESRTDESLSSAVAKFAKWLGFDKEKKSNNPLDKITILNPETENKIKMQSALKKDEDDPVKKLADDFYDEYKKDKEKESSSEVLNRDIEQEYKKREEERKKEYKEYDQEWTDEDSRNLKNEILLDFYQGAKDPETQKKIEDMYIDQKDIKPHDYARAAMHFSDEGCDRTIEKLGKEKIDKLLKDPNGEGQNLGELILRSKNATPEQRKKALMYQWVENPQSPGSLMMADHLAKKLEMGKKAQDGLAYRKGEGESFDDRPYGGVRDDVKEANLKAVDDIYTKTQEYYKKKGIKEIEVYRGSDEEAVDKYENPVESWTSDKEVGKNYGEHTHKKKISVERILMGHFDENFPDPFAFGATDKDGKPVMSKEIVVLGGK